MRYRSYKVTPTKNGRVRVTSRGPFATMFGIFFWMVLIVFVFVVHWAETLLILIGLFLIAGLFQALRQGARKGMAQAEAKKASKSQPRVPRV